MCSYITFLVFCGQSSAPNTHSSSAQRHSGEKPLTRMEQAAPTRPGRASPPEHNYCWWPEAAQTHFFPPACEPREKKNPGEMSRQQKQHRTGPARSIQARTELHLWEGTRGHLHPVSRVLWSTQSHSGPLSYGYFSHHRAETRTHFKQQWTQFETRSTEPRWDTAGAVETRSGP